MSINKPLTFSITSFISFFMLFTVAFAGTTRVSVNSVDAEVDGSSERPSISSDGRYIVFGSEATNLVAGDTNATNDIFLHDTQTGATTRVSVDSVGAEADGSSEEPSISSDGRYVVFNSEATNLVAGDTNAAQDIFVHDTQTGATTRVSVNSVGAEANDRSIVSHISSDGRYVVFNSEATNLVAGDTNAARDIFVHDTQTGATTRVSVNSVGAEANDRSERPSISSDGRYVVFSSEATNLVAGDTNGVDDIFIATLTISAPAEEPSSRGYTHPPLCTATTTPSTITKGEQATLSWDIQWPTNRRSTFYMKVPKEGLFTSNVQSITISPEHTTTYRLATFNLFGANFCESTITVQDEQGTELTTPTPLLSASASSSPFVKALLSFLSSLFGR